jgi:hypothetical protein
VDVDKRTQITAIREPMVELLDQFKPSAWEAATICIRSMATGESLMGTLKKLAPYRRGAFDCNGLSLQALRSQG